MRIGELARASGVTARTLRFYEREGLLADPGRTPGGYRDYSAEAVDRVAFIRQAQSAGLTLRQIRGVLAVRDDGRAPCRDVEEFVDARLTAIRQRLEELESTRRSLLELRARLASLDTAACDPEGICSAVTGDL